MSILVSDFFSIHEFVTYRGRPVLVGISDRRLYNRYVNAGNTFKWKC